MIEDIRTATQSCQDPNGTSSWSLLETGASLANPVGSQWEDSPIIKNTMLKLDVLDLKGANNAASKLQLAVHCDPC
jgi:hypothetical protein